MQVLKQPSDSLVTSPGIEAQQVKHIDWAWSAAFCKAIFWAGFGAVTRVVDKETPESDAPTAVEAVLAHDAAVTASAGWAADKAAKDSAIAQQMAAAAVNLADFRFVMADSFMIGQ